MDRKRWFRLVTDNGVVGRFSGQKPKQAAGKALTAIVRHAIQKGGDDTGTYEFAIKECTRGGKCKTYFYVGERMLRNEPMEVQIGGRMVTYKFNNRVMKNKNVDETRESGVYQTGGTLLSFV